MTVGVVLGKSVATGTGSTAAFPFNAPVAAVDELAVYTVVIATGVQTKQTRGGSGTYDFNVSLNSSTSYATVTLNNNLPDTHQVIILREVAIKQETDYVAGDAFPAETHEAALDKLTYICTQLSERIDRTIKFQEALANDLPGSITLSSTNRAGKAIIFDGSGNISVSETAFTTLEANITTVAGQSTQIGLLGTSSAVADMALLADSAVIADMALLGTSAVVADMALLGDSAVIADMALLADSAVIADMALLGTSAVVEDMGLLGTSANVTAMGNLGTSANVTNMSTITTGFDGGTGTSGTNSNLSNINTCATNIGSLNTVATNAESNAIVMGIALG